MGEFGIPRIALRGPGCINGTGRCNVAGAQGRCTNVFGTGDCLDDNVRGTGGRRDCIIDRLEDVLGEFGSQRCCSNVAGTSDRRRNNNVAGTGSRRRNCDCCCECLETPITVPR